MSTHDDFLNDTEVIDNAQGVLAGDGFRDFETIQEKMTPGQPGQPPTGYTFSLHCVNCSTRNGVSLSWMEIVDVAAGAVPVDPDTGQRWIFHGGKATPPCACGKCGKQIFVYVTPDQCQRYVRAGVQAGALDPNYVGQRTQAIRQQAAAYNQQRR